MISVGGYLVITLFFSDRLGFQQQKLKFVSFHACVGRLFYALLLPFTFGIMVPILRRIAISILYHSKSISFFNIFERFEVLVANLYAL